MTLEGEEEASTEEISAAGSSEPKSIDLQTVGSIGGNVSYQGTPPEREKVVMAGFADCKAHHATTPLREDLLVENGKVQNVIVYIQDKYLKGYQFETPKEPAVLDQRGCLYAPHVAVMQTGQELKIKNSDDTVHNVHSHSEKNKVFNDAMPPQSEAITKSFKRSEVIRLTCDIHPWMESYLGVFSHPFFAVTGKDGSFELKGVPPGKYTVVALHEKMGSRKLTVEVKAKEAVPLNFEFP